MADSKQLAIQRALSAHLAGITPANGYEFDLTGAVFRGRAVFGEDDPVPLLSILEFPKQDIGAAAAEMGIKRNEDWDLLVQGWADDDPENPTDRAYRLKADVELRLSDIIATTNGDGKFPEYRLGGLITNLVIGSGVVRPPDGQVSAKAFFYIPLKVKFVTEISKRFTAP